MTYVITELCILDGACVEVCPVDCIHTEPEAPQFYIDPDICIECEQCVVVCPVEAVFLDIELPDEYLKAEADNASFFHETKEEAEQLPHHTALEMIHEAEAYARRMGHQVSVAVVDGSGIPIAMSRMDGATPWSTELALNKAYTATLYSLNTDASRLAHRSLAVMSQGKIMAGAGGLSVMGDFGTVTIGAIGVAGSATDDNDLSCARAGVTVLDNLH